MSDKSRNNQRRIRVRSIRRQTPDVRKLGAALLELALAEAEAAAMAEHARTKPTKAPTDRPGGEPPEAA